MRNFPCRCRSAGPRVPSLRRGPLRWCPLDAIVDVEFRIRDGNTRRNCITKVTGLLAMGRLDGTPRNHRDRLALQVRHRDGVQFGAPFENHTRGRGRLWPIPPYSGGNNGVPANRERRKGAASMGLQALFFYLLPSWHGNRFHGDCGAAIRCFPFVS